MNTLYIIGNGFDLHHGLPTSLTGFRNHSKYSEFHRLYESDIFNKNPNKPLEDHWKYLEENLAEFEVDALIEYASQYADDDPHENQFIYVAEDTVNVLTKGLVADLKEYLSLAEMATVGQDKILKLDTSARFLCFNYTNTLERIYNIAPNKICYIHGKLNTPNAPIVIGHGREDAEYTPEPEIDISTLSEQEKEAYSDSYSPDYEYVYRVAHSYLKRSYKDTDTCIKASSEFLQSLSDINRVIILGHSLTDIDQPYLNYVKNVVRTNCQWWATYYPSDQQEVIFERLDGIVDDHNKMNLFEMAQLTK